MNADPTEPPPRIRRREIPDGIELRRHWLTPATVVVTVLALVWNGLLVYLLYPGMLHGEASARVWAAVVSFTSFGIVLAYLALAGLFNSTRIALDSERLAVTQGPLPWPGAHGVARALIAHVYAKQIDSASGDLVRHEVWLVLREGPPRRLLPNRLDGEEARYLARELAQALGLPEHEMRVEERR